MFKHLKDVLMSIPTLKFYQSEEGFFILKRGLK